MRGHLNVKENERIQREGQAESQRFARTKANSNTPWPQPVKPKTYGEVLDEEQQLKEAA